jgi:hypothetical protein
MGYLGTTFHMLSFSVMLKIPDTDRIVKYPTHIYVFLISMSVSY